MDHLHRIAALNLFAGWCGFLCGVISGAMAGLLFHRDDWMGGYGSYRRRLMRLGHISFFGLGILNLFFGLTLNAAPFPERWAQVASACLLIGSATMPVCCFLAAWRKPMRHLFPVPVISLLTGVSVVVLAWGRL